MKKYLSLFLAGLALVLALACALPAQAAFLISKEQEIEMGRATAQKLEAQYGLYQDWEQTERVQRIGKSLAAVCGRTDIDYSFKILNVNQVNALACPGGFIYVFKGLLDYMPTDTELAGVLGHEIGHVAKRHTVNAIEKQLLTSVLLAVATKGEGMGLLSIAQQALFAGYSRTDERGADKEGFYNTMKAGYNPYAMLITASKLEDLTKQGGGSNYGLFSSHPEPEERVERQWKLLKKLKILPAVVVQEDSATVKEGDWTFNISHSIGNTKAAYRAYMLAGGLWVARQRGPIDANRFLVYDRGPSADIYYDDIQLLRVYSQDAQGFSPSAGSYAAACTSLLRDWARLANAADAAAAAKNKKKKKD